VVEKQVMIFSCVACGAASYMPWLDACEDYYLGHPRLTTYVQCSACHLVQQHPAPADPKELYENYPVHEKKSALHRWARSIVFRAAYFDPSNLPHDTSLLDFGCGDGWFLDSVRNRIAGLHGFEFLPEHARELTEALGIPIYSTWDAAMKHGPYDAITLHYVMEHLPDPAGTLGEIRKLLSPGGLVYILLPDIHSWEARWFGRRWHGLDQPRHISFPDLAILRSMATKAGFEIVSAKSKPFPNTLAASLAVVLNGRFSTRWFMAFLPLALVVSRLFPGGSKGYLLRSVQPE
jgi:SAM-dependent methyltransferase